MRVLDTSGTVHTGHNPGSIARRLYGRTAWAVEVQVRTGVVHRWEVYAYQNGAAYATYVTDLYPTDEDHPRCAVYLMPGVRCAQPHRHAGPCKANQRF